MSVILGKYAAILQLSADLLIVSLLVESPINQIRPSSTLLSNPLTCQCGRESVGECHTLLSWCFCGQIFVSHRRVQHFVLTGNSFLFFEARRWASLSSHVALLDNFCSLQKPQLLGGHCSMASIWSQLWLYYFEACFRDSNSIQSWLLPWVLVEFWCICCCFLINWFSEKLFSLKNSVFLKFPNLTVLIARSTLNRVHLHPWK